MKNLNIINVNVYKPEFSECPVCKDKLVYKYATNSKNVQFRTGKTYLIKNLAYTCKNNGCSLSNNIFTSQSVNRICLKGCTYSVNLIWTMIYLYHYKKQSIETISSLLINDSIQISDKNILLLIKKNYKLLSLDYINNIESNFSFMNNNYNILPLFVNVVRIEKKCIYLNIKNPISNENIGSHFIEEIDYQKVICVLKPYFDTKYKVTHLFIDMDNSELMLHMDKLLSSKHKGIQLYNFIKYKDK